MKSIDLDILELVLKGDKGHSKKNLAKLGIPWPPPKGWRKALQKKHKVSPKKKKPRAIKKLIKQQKRNFYKTAAWAKLRYQALKMNDGCCECCGRDKQDGIKLNVDHIKPVKQYPKLALKLSNTQVLCGLCNWGKGGWDETDWREPSLKVLMGEEMK